MIVNLDSNPYDRWADIVAPHKEDLLKVVSQIDKISGSIPFIGSLGLEFVLNTIQQKIDAGGVLYYDELRGIADTIDVDVRRVILLQLCYEFFSACTCVSMLVEDEPALYRTMDWEMPELKPLTKQFEFMRNGEIVFRSVSWVGYVGVFTGVRRGLALALNFRTTNQQTSITQNFWRATNKMWPAGYLLRQCLEHASPDEVCPWIEQTQLISPCYISVLLGDQAHVYAMNNDFVALHRSRNIKDHNDALVQANIDNPNEKGNNILWSKERVKQVDTFIKSRTDSDKNDVIKSLGYFPVKNMTSIYRCILVPSIGQITFFQIF